MATVSKLIYGTAWKGDLTSTLVEKAILNGFRAIDTACQPKHYNEKGVGDALRHLMQSGTITRDDVFIQTKFTPLSGHDTRVPYDPRAPISLQVKQSFAVSMRNLGVDSVDSLVLHSPYQRYDQTMEAWRAFESIHSAGGAKQLGISNIYDLDLLQKIYEDSSVKPQIVQNRFYVETNYDSELRAWCRTKHIRYQAFWVLTANPKVLRHPKVRTLAERLNRTPPQIHFRYLMQNGVDPLTGTTSESHMKEDLEVYNFALRDEELMEVHSALGLDPSL